MNSGNRNSSIATVSAPPAIIVGLDSVTGLQAARILARRGVRVVGVADDPRSFACRTRACERVVPFDAGSEALIETLETLGERGNGGVLIPCGDNLVHRLSHHRDRLTRFHTICLPDHGTVEKLLFKAAFSEYAKREGLPIPLTFILPDRAGASKAAHELRFPCVLKPDLKTSTWKGLPKAIKVLSERELLDAYDRVSPFADRLVAQEWIEGQESDLYACRVYFDRDAKPLVTFVARKIRQWPLETGSGSAAIECRNDEVLRNTLKLFEGVGLQAVSYTHLTLPTTPYV